jgi:hypothetical protein
MTKRHWVVVAVGVTIAVVGIGLGMSAVTLSSYRVSCGSAWSTSYVPYFSEECSDARSTKGLIAVVITVAGLLVAAASVVSAYLSKPTASV